MKQIGVIGCGLMGFGIATNLMKEGYDVTVFDTNPEAVQRVVTEGASSAKSVEELAMQMDIIVLSLPSTPLVKRILTDKTDGILRQMTRGSVVLDMSTNDVETTKWLAEQAREAGVYYYDCPVSGGPDGAKNGTLTIMVGGDKDKFVEVSPILETMGTHVELLGPSGSGQVVKLCNNMVVGGIISLLGEALLTGERAGIQKEKLGELFQKGSAQTKVMDVFGPNIVEGTFDDVTFSLANMMKDLSLYRNLAESEGVPTSASSSSHLLYTIATYGGHGLRDSTAIAELLEKQTHI